MEGNTKTFESMPFRFKRNPKRSNKIREYVKIKKENCALIPFSYPHHDQLIEKSVYAKSRL